MHKSIYLDMSISPEEIKKLYLSTPKSDKVSMHITLLREDAEFLKTQAFKNFQFEKAGTAYQVTKILRDCKELSKKNKD